MTTALVAQRLPLPAKRNGALGARKGGGQRQPAQPARTVIAEIRITRQRSDCRKTGNPQEHPEPTSKCTIPFGHPPLTETTRISENHFTNVKTMP